MDTASPVPVLAASILPSVLACVALPTSAAAAGPCDRPLLRAEGRMSGWALAPAYQQMVARRLSLALVGTVPSLQEIRQLEARPKNQDPLAWYTAHLLEDRRHADYWAERLARTYVGTENGPFVVYRRRRFVTWISDQLLAIAQQHAKGRLVSALEGGYDLDALAESAAAHVRALMKA